MKLAALVDGVCAVCRVPPSVHARCAVCEGSNQLVRVCAFCRAWNERAGVAWNDKRLDSAAESRADDDEPIITRARPLRDAMAPTRGRGRPRSTKIDDAVLPLLMSPRERVLVERIDRRGRNRGYYWRWSTLSLREIERRAGCSRMTANRRYRDYAGAKTRTLRARPARRLTKNMK